MVSTTIAKKTFIIIPRETNVPYSLNMQVKVTQSNTYPTLIMTQQMMQEAPSVRSRSK